MRKDCVLYDRECIGCGECDRCDLDPNKICDNCMKCVRGDAEYRGIRIDGIVINPAGHGSSGDYDSPESL